MASEAKEQRRLVAVTLDEASIGRGNPDQEHERAIAIYDILEENTFALPNYDGGPMRCAFRSSTRSCAFRSTRRTARISSPTICR
jgi:uncharacterized protein (UPF0262 family)